MTQVNNKDLILKQIPLFASLPAEDSRLLKDRFEIIEYKKNQVIYEENSPADAFYCIIWGRIVIYTKDRFGNETVLEYLHRGRYFGIISLLTGGAHSVSARAINDSAVLVIKKPDFDFLLERVPKLAIDLSRTLSRRLKNKDIHQKTIFESTIISVFSSYSQAGKTVYALNLAISLSQETHKSVIILDLCQDDVTHSLPQKLNITDKYTAVKLSEFDTDKAEAIRETVIKNNFGIDLICVNYKDEVEPSIRKLFNILSLLINDYHYIVLDLPSSMDQFVFSVLNQSDLIHLLTGSDPVELKKTHSLIHRLKTDLNFQESKIKIIINEYKLSKITSQEQCGLLDYNVYATLHRIQAHPSDRLVLDEPDSEYAKTVRRVSRDLGDCLVGLALGVGMGYGLCHIGILKVIEEENIPIDVISGSSIGALIASLWVTGRRAEEILQIVKSEFGEPRHAWGIVDLTFPSLGFIKGNKFYKFLKKYLGSKTFCEIKLPLKIVASNIKKKESRVIDKGLLIDAIMASCAMPGVFIPFKLKEEVLVDGGILSPLPTEILFKMGINKIIAVNVTPSREDILKEYRQLKEEIALNQQALRKKEWFSIKRYLQNRFKVNILDIIFTSVEAMQSEIIRREEQWADIVLHPDTQGLHWLELHRVEEFLKRGEEEIRKNLDNIRRVIS